MLSKRERLEKTIGGEPTDRVPAALWRHFPGDDQRTADFAQSVVEFQRQYDWDFVNVNPAYHYSLMDYGLQDDWRGDATGRRVTSKFAVKRSLDWTDLRALDPQRGEIGRTVETLRQIVDGLAVLGSEVPIILTIPSPLTQAARLGGMELLLRHMRTQADRLHSGLNTLTESTLRLLEALRQRTDISGICYDVGPANYDSLSVSEYDHFGVPYDRKILDALPQKWWLNIVQLQGAMPMFEICKNYAVQVLNWYDQCKRPDLTTGKALFAGAVCGGLGQVEHLRDGTPATIAAAAREAIRQTGSRRFILAANDVTLLTSPWSNLRAVRQAVESAALQGEF